MPLSPVVTYSKTVPYRFSLDFFVELKCAIAMHQTEIAMLNPCIFSPDLIDQTTGFVRACKDNTWIGDVCSSSLMILRNV